MALRPGATGMFLWAVDEGVTRRNGTAGRLMTTAWVAVGRSERGSAGAPPGAWAPEAPGPPGRVVTPGPGLGDSEPGRDCIPGRAPGRPVWETGPRGGAPPGRRPAGAEPGRAPGGTVPGRMPWAGGLERICAGRNPWGEVRSGGRAAGGGAAEPGGGAMAGVGSETAGTSGEWAAAGTSAAAATGSAAGAAAIAGASSAIRACGSGGGGAASGASTCSGGWTTSWAGSPYSAAGSWAAGVAGSCWCPLVCGTSAPGARRRTTKPLAVAGGGAARGFRFSTIRWTADVAWSSSSELEWLFTS